MSLVAHLLSALVIGLVLALSSVGAASAQPTSSDAMLALDAAFQKMKAYDGTEVTTIFQDVTPGAANGGSFPFRVSMVVHTVEPGYPANGYFGKSCIETFRNIDFQLSADGFGSWEASGPMSAYNVECTDNPADGVLSIPPESIPGQTVAGLSGTDSLGPAGGSLTVGSWTCWGPTGLVASIDLAADGYYTDTGGNYGTYQADMAAGAIYFTDAALNGVVGSELKGQSFRIGDNVLCQPS